MTTSIELPHTWRKPEEVLDALQQRFLIDYEIGAHGKKKDTIWVKATAGVGALVSVENSPGKMTVHIKGESPSILLRILAARTLREAIYKERWRRVEEELAGFLRSPRHWRPPAT